MRRWAANACVLDSFGTAEIGNYHKALLVAMMAETTQIGRNRQGKFVYFDTMRLS